MSLLYVVSFFFNDTATAEIYTYLHTLALHYALPISVAVLVGQTHHLRTVAEHFGRQRRGDDANIRQAGELALQHRVGAQFAVKFDQRHMGAEAGEVDRGLDAAVAAAGRPAERRVGKECVSRCRARGTWIHKKQTRIQITMTN